MTDPYDKGLSLDEVIDRARHLDKNQDIKVYFDPTTWLFYILYDATLTILIPEGAYMLSYGPPGALLISICRALSTHQS